MDKIAFNDTDFILIYNSPSSSVYYNAGLKMAICIANVEYIPIENFKEVFLAVSGLIGKFPMQHFLFDKRNLRTFHQPSMEWYFTVWKQQVKTEGLVHHYKILPNLEWFVQSVNAGKDEITKKYGNALLDGLTVQYVDSAEQAIELARLA